MVGVKGSVRYAVGARRAVLAAVLVLAAVGVAVVLEHGGAGRSEPASGQVAGAGRRTGTPTPSPSTAPAPVGPAVVRDALPLGAARLDETSAYAKRHYGTTSTVLRPRLVVLHYTESDTYASARSLFAADEPNHGELPGVCSHYVVEQDGTVHELVPPTVMCRHTIGLNDSAIGVEFVQASHGHGAGWAEGQVLGRRPQAEAGAALVRMLQAQFHIPPEGVIGHAMANDAKEFHDREGWRNDHLDWPEGDVARFRALVAAAD